jgi:hypothetical protein
MTKIYFINHFLIQIAWISLLILFASFGKWDVMHVFHDLLFFVVCFDSNIYDYDNVVCVNQKDSASRLGMHSLT